MQLKEEFCTDRGTQRNICNFGCPYHSLDQDEAIAQLAYACPPLLVNIVLPLMGVWPRQNPGWGCDSTKVAKSPPPSVIPDLPSKTSTGFSRFHLLFIFLLFFSVTRAYTVVIQITKIVNIWRPSRIVYDTTSTACLPIQDL